MVNGDKVIEVEDLTKVYPAARRLLGDGGVEKLAVDRVSFDVRRGEIFGLLGPNGAGKTTTIKMLSTLLIPTFGKAGVLGLDVVRDAVRLRPRIKQLVQQARPFLHDEDVAVAVAGRSSFDRRVGRYRVGTRVALVVVLEVDLYLGLTGRHHHVGDPDGATVPQARAEVGLQALGGTDGVHQVGGVRQHRGVYHLGVPVVVAGEHGALGAGDLGITGRQSSRNRQERRSRRRSREDPSSSHSSSHG